MKKPILLLGSFILILVLCATIQYLPVFYQAKNNEKIEKKEEVTNIPSAFTVKQCMNGEKQLTRDVVALVNEERQKVNLPPLLIDQDLEFVAGAKTWDMMENKYFSHESPTYGTIFKMLQDFNVSYITVGENIARGEASPQQVVKAWMNSKKHRDNMLGKKFTHIGVGYKENGHYWVQVFISR